MDNPFHYDPDAYHAQVVHIAEQVVIDDGALPTVAPRRDEAAERIATRDPGAPRPSGLGHPGEEV